MRNTGDMTDSGKTMRVKQQKSGNGNTSFHLLNNIITKEDITPLSKFKSKSKTSGKTDGKDEKEPVIVDSIPTDIKPTNDSMSDSDSHNEDAYSLFSPMTNSLHDDNDYEYYSDDLALEKFQNYQINGPKKQKSKNNADNNNKPTGLELTRNDDHFDIDELALPSPLSDTNDDFWKEVKTTNEEAICLPDNDENVVVETPQRKSSVVVDQNVSVNDFIDEDIAASNNKEWNDKLVDDSSYKVKLLCYRDADGKLALKTRNVPIALKNNRATTGLVSKRTTLRGKLLRKAIRRKSGVAQMISTDVGISELML